MSYTVIHNLRVGLYPFEWKRSKCSGIELGPVSPRNEETTSPDMREFRKERGTLSRSLHLACDQGPEQEQVTETVHSCVGSCEPPHTNTSYTRGTTNWRRLVAQSQRSKTRERDRLKQQVSWKSFGFHWRLIAQDKRYRTLLEEVGESKKSCPKHRLGVGPARAQRSTAPRARPCYATRSQRQTGSSGMETVARRGWLGKLENVLAIWSKLGDLRFPVGVDVVVGKTWLDTRRWPA